MSDESCLDAISAARVLAEISYGKMAGRSFGTYPARSRTGRTQQAAAGTRLSNLVLYAAISQFARGNNNGIKRTARAGLGNDEWCKIPRNKKRKTPAAAEN